MPRKAREKSQSGIYHVLVSGHNKQNIFSCDDDKRKFLSLLEEYRDLCGFKVYAYALLDSHLHLVINEFDTTVARVMTRIGTSYVTWFNSRYERNGALFDDRFKSEVINGEESYKKAVRFVNMNPVLEKAVSNISEYAFTSYNDYFQNAYISSDMTRRVFGGVVEFAEYHKQSIKEKCLDIKASQKILTDSQLENIFEKEFFVRACDLALLPSEQITKILISLSKSYNIPIRQIARVTNLSSSKIWRYSNKTVAIENV